MKKVIKGKTYNTATARLIACHCRIVGNWHDYRITLWRTPLGVSFATHEMYVKGVWAVSWYPLSEEEAKEWRRDEGLVAEAA